MALESQGLFCWFTTTTSGSTAATALVEEVKSISGPSGAAAVLDITHLQSTAKEKMIGLRDEGQISLSVNYVCGTNATNMQNKMRESRAQRTKSCIRIGFSDTYRTMLGAKCYVSGFAVNAGVDNVLEGNITCEISGPVTFTTYTA